MEGKFDSVTTVYYIPFMYKSDVMSLTLNYRVVFSIWDQGGCDRDHDSNACSGKQVARTVACGTGIECTDFGGEGTGRKR